MYAAGIDSGTQGTKAVIVDYETGRVVGRGYAGHAVINGLPPGHSEQEPETWLEAFRASLEKALKASRIRPADVVSLGVSGQQHGFVPLDRRGLPVRPAKLWNDTSTIEETGFIIDRLGGKKAYIKKLGLNLAVGFTASKILWLKRHEPANYRRLSTVLLPHNYLNYYLTGIKHMEYGDASGTGLMDIRRRRWAAEAIEAIDPRLKDMLPALSHPQEPVGFMRAKVVRLFGFKRVLVSAGSGDNMMGAIGTGNVAPGICTLSLGSSGTVYSHFDHPFIDPEGEIAAFCGGTGGWLPLLCTMNATNTTEAIKKIFSLTNRGLEADAQAAPAGSNGLTFLPFLDGERVPPLPSAAGVFFGLNRRNFDRANMARAVLEGTILNLGYGFSRMKQLGLDPSEIRATGGGANNKLWLQTAADVFGFPVVTLGEKEAAAYGAALQSIWCYLWQQGEKSSISDIVSDRVVKNKKVFYPDQKNAALFRDRQARFNSLWRRLRPEFARLRPATGR